MVMRAFPVRIEEGAVSSLDGTPLPRRANAVLVVLPEAGNDPRQTEWLAAFRDCLSVLRERGTGNADDVTDGELNKLVHAARR